MKNITVTIEVAPAAKEDFQAITNVDTLAPVFLRSKSTGVYQA